MQIFTTRAGEIAQQVKHLSHKNRNPSLNLQNLGKKTGMVIAYSPSAGGTQMGPWARSLADQPNLMYELQACERRHLKQGGQLLRNTS